MGPGREKVQSGDLVAEVSNVIERAYLVVHGRVVIVAIELRGIEAKRVTCGRGMPEEAFRATGIAPYLRPNNGAIVNDKFLVQTRIRNQCRIRQGSSPAIGHAVDSLRISNEQARLQVPG